MIRSCQAKHRMISVKWHIRALWTSSIISATQQIPKTTADRKRRVDGVVVKAVEGGRHKFISCWTSCRMGWLPAQSALRSACRCSWQRPSPCSSGRPLGRLRRKERGVQSPGVSHGKCYVVKSPSVTPVGVRMSESGNSSKFEVSSMLLISMGMAAGLSLQSEGKLF